MMKEIFRKNGLPEDIVYLAMIESGFNPKAYSRAHASGPWQFIKGTGQRYGLKINRWLDERRDPEKSTIAAAKYLKNLYDMFGCWYLAAAAYNAGENKILQAIDIYNTRDFWEIARYPYLARETKDFVPQLIASVIIAKDPEKYGFDDIDYKLPFTYNKVHVPDTTNLKVIARACKTDYDTIKMLNPELKKGCTPPNYPDYELRVPIGRKEVFAKNFDKTEPSERSTFTRHTVKRGETLSRIASLYDTSTEPIMQLNKIKNPRGIKAGRTLIIPVRSSKIAKRDTDKKRGFILSKVAKKGYLESERKEIMYTVRKGDTLWNIAQRYDLKTSEIRYWNKMGIKDTIHTGTTLRLMVKLDLDT
jgi:membrane-bound lytic murein transglycosylase D